MFGDRSCLVFETRVGPHMKYLNMSLQTNGKSDCYENFGSCSYDSEALVKVLES